MAAYYSNIVEKELWKKLWIDNYFKSQKPLLPIMALKKFLFLLLMYRYEKESKQWKWVSRGIYKNKIQLFTYSLQISIEHSLWYQAPHYFRNKTSWKQVGRKESKPNILRYKKPNSSLKEPQLGEETCSGNQGENLGSKLRSKLIPLHCFHYGRHLRGQKLFGHTSEATFAKKVHQSLQCLKLRWANT